MRRNKNGFIGKLRIICFFQPKIPGSCKYILQAFSSFWLLEMNRIVKKHFHLLADCMAVFIQPHNAFQNTEVNLLNPFIQDHWDLSFSKHSLSRLSCTKEGT